MFIYKFILFRMNICKVCDFLVFKLDRVLIRLFFVNFIDYNRIVLVIVTSKRLFIDRYQATIILCFCVSLLIGKQDYYGINILYD